MSEVLNHDNYVTNEPKKPSFEIQKSRFYPNLKNNPSFQELHQKQVEESKELEINNEIQKQNISNETHETLDKEALVSNAKKFLYESFGLKENLGENSSLENFLKGIVDEAILGNGELLIEIVNTKGEILIDAISKLLTWEGLKNVAVSLGETIWNLFDGDAYEKGKSVAELGIIGTGLGAGVALGKKGLKVGLKKIAKHSVNKENLVKSEGLKEVVKETNTNVANIIPKKQFDPEKMLIVDIAKLGDQDRVLAGKMLLKRDLNEIEQKAILDSHYVGADRAEAGINNYNFAEKRQKYIILKNAGFTEEEIKTLMQKGVCGKLQEKQVVQEVTQSIDFDKMDTLEFKGTYALDEIKGLKPFQAKELIEKFANSIDINYLINNPRRIDSLLDIVESMCDYIQKNEGNINKLSKQSLTDFKFSFTILRNKILELKKSNYLTIYKDAIMEIKTKKINPIYSNFNY